MTNVMTIVVASTLPEFDLHLADKNFIGRFSFG
jgi:hypothetical protein